jgi:hypothetical protein
MNVPQSSMVVRALPTAATNLMQASGYVHLRSICVHLRFQEVPFRQPLLISEREDAWR